MASILGVTRQTISKFGSYCEADEDNTNNTMLLSVISLMDNFLYENRYDCDHIVDYINKLDSYFFSEIYDNKELFNKIENIKPLYFGFEGEVERSYTKLWLDTFRDEEGLEQKEYIEVDFRKPTIRQIASNYHIYILSDFCTSGKANIFLIDFFKIIINKRNKIKISNLTIDKIQSNRLSTERNIHLSSIDTLNLLQIFRDNKRLHIIESNPKSKNELELVINEINGLDKKNAIVLTNSNINEVVQLNNWGLNIFNSDYKVLALELKEDEEINLDKQSGYEIYH